MNQKVKGLVSIGVLIVVSMFCAYLAWTKAGAQSGFLAIFLKIIAVVFGLTVVAAGGCMFWYAGASQEKLAKPKKGKGKGASRSGTTSSSSDFSFSEPTISAPAEPTKKAPRPAGAKPAAKTPTPVAKQPRPAPKKAPRPAGDASGE